MSNETGDNCRSYEECYIKQELIFIPEVQRTFLLLYFMVSIIGTLGNLFIVITVIRCKFSSTKTLILIDPDASEVVSEDESEVDASPKAFV